MKVRYDEIIKDFESESWDWLYKHSDINIAFQLFVEKLSTLSHNKQTH